MTAFFIGWWGSKGVKGHGPFTHPPAWRKQSNSLAFTALGNAKDHLRLSEPPLPLEPAKAAASEAWSQAYGVIERCVSSNLPQGLYHYTDANGFIGIVGTGKFLASNVEFMNDLEELKRGKRIASETIEAYLEHSTPAFSQLLKNVLKLINEPGQTDVYVACFCSEDNLLSQWQGYGSMGSGISIGFEPKSLTTAFPTTTRLMRVVYEETEQFALIAEVLACFSSHFEKACLVGTPETMLSEFTWRLWGLIESILPAIKVNCFRFEKEWRLVHTKYRGLAGALLGGLVTSYRSRNGYIVPYVELSTRDDEQQLSLFQTTPQPIKLPVISVTIGPAADTARMQAGVQRVLQSSFHTVIPDVSDIPYRP